MLRLLLLFLLVSCTDPQGSPGEQIYRSHCAGCHSPDPKQDAYGPSLKGSSLELLTGKVNFGVYPEGYKPKRETKFMPRFLLTTKELAEVWQFLNQE